MDHSTIVLAVIIAAGVIGLLHCLFGYKLARFLLPLCGVALVEFALFKFVYPNIELNATWTWVFFAGSALAVYIALFFLPRIAAFIAGMTGSALALIYAVFAFSLSEIPIVYPIGLALCVLCGLLTAVYKRVGVVIFAAVLGGCVTSFAAVFYFYGADIVNYLLKGIVLVPMTYFLKAHALLISGGALALCALGLLVQLKVTANSQWLDRRPRNDSHAIDF